MSGFVAESGWRHPGLGSGSRHSGHYESRTGSNMLPLTRGKGECENAIRSRNWTAGCGESYLSGAGSAGRKSTVERQHGRRPSTPWFTALQSRPMEFLDFTSLTLDEFQQLVPPFEAAFHARMAAWQMDGKPRTARRFTVYKNCPLPTPEDRLLFILAYLKTYALQVVQGRLFGMVQGKANQWIHALLPALLAALRALGDAPARSLAALAQRLGISKADAATVVVPLKEESAPGSPIPAAAPASPLLPMTGPNGASSAPKTLVNSKQVIAGRKKTTPSKMSCS